MDLPANVSGNSVSAVGVGNPVSGNESANGTADQPPHLDRSVPDSVDQGQPPVMGEPLKLPRTHAGSPSSPQPELSCLADTGTDATVPAAAASAALVLGGADLHRRFKPTRRCRRASGGGHGRHDRNLRRAVTPSLPLPAPRVPLRRRPATR
ncbi:chaplin family protein [Streptomyces sp. NPDC002817]